MRCVNPLLSGNAPLALIPRFLDVDAATTQQPRLRMINANCLLFRLPLELGRGNISFAEAGWKVCSLRKLNSNSGVCSALLNGCDVMAVDVNIYLEVA